MRCLLLLYSSLTPLSGQWDCRQSCKYTLNFLIARHKSFGRATIASHNIKHVLWRAIAARVAFYSRPGLYLNSETLSNDENLNIQGCNLVRADRLSNTKRGGVCIYFKESLPLRLYNVSYLNECICFEIMISNKLCNFISLYRSPSQSSDEFENFSYNLDLTLEAFTQKNPFLTVIIRDFNVKFNNWCFTDKTTPEGVKLDYLTSHYGLTQL